MGSEKIDVVVVGGGPAGLFSRSWPRRRACARSRRSQPSVGRKFLVAGRGRAEPDPFRAVENFSARYGDSENDGKSCWPTFADDLRAWAKGLGIETFIVNERARFSDDQAGRRRSAPLDRRLRKQGVSFARHGLAGFRRTKARMEVEFTTRKARSCCKRARSSLPLAARRAANGFGRGWTNLLGKAGIAVIPSPRRLRLRSRLAG